MMYQMEDHPQNKKVGQNCPKFSKVPVVVGRTGDSFQQNHGFYGTRVALSTSSGASHLRIRHLFRLYTPTPLENNRLLEPQNDGLKAHLSLQGQPTTCALPTFCCLLQTLFYQLKLSKQPNLSKFIFALAQGLHGSIRAQHRTLIKIMDDQSLTC